MPDPSISVRLGENLHLIPLPVSLAGFEGFITAWVYTGGPVVLIDVGPSSSNGHLQAALQEMGVRRLDYILLTHVHLDHSGAIGDIAAAFPGTPVVCHPKAAEHLIAPQRLWQGSLKTLGEVARRYGPVTPVPPGQVLTADRLNVPQIIPVPTPGHAPHHYSYLLGPALFAGEAGGVCLPLGTDRVYMRPATPPRFILEIYLASIDRLTAYEAQTICYGHVGAQPDAAGMLRLHRSQLLRWRDMLEPWYERDSSAGEKTLSDCLEHMLRNDPLLSGFPLLSAHERERERFFLRNSLRGYWGYFMERKGTI